ncbi:MAG: amidophosphoribosyltransferase [Candidatus Omnitrophica bacterium CG11_big_fil_rev_8_21_14_0_20_42_13]|uniref:Amidophosphoribosyltransferase n=1 Tax=Candidatus Ghiorseimicrobium undicola TaxID=1974746 RepID=A0A2H0LZG0_9BACT|nr:MAG: amidophosphoribosyltransferase [Candidatus Omnitrophica bacterium CG11_big_fil_rev_8_21_14_0_20_42_13]
MPRKIYSFKNGLGPFLNFDKPKECCGLFGIYDNYEAPWLTYLGLYSLQHRGEEACGIAVSDGRRLSILKGTGLVSEVFNEENIKKLSGFLSIGHLRYSTTGSSVLKNAQPLVVDYLRGSLAIGHNGNLINSIELRRKLENSGSTFQTTTDSEIVVQLMARSRHPDVIKRLIYALNKVKGAYSLLLMTKDKVIGARDPMGFRPLVLGRINKSFCLASETCALDLIGAKLVREIEPGEIVVIDKKGVKSFRFSPKQKKHAFCIFEHVYFSRPDSVVFGQTVYSVRKKLGAELAKEHYVDADLVIPVPDSGTSAAIGFSQASNIPMEMGIIRNHYIGRTFIQPSQHIRDLGVRVKFNLLRDIIKGKRVIIVDDSIVRGTTSRKRVKAFRALGAKEVHLRISCPPHKFPCHYGIDFHDQKELIAVRLSHERIKKYLNVESLGYLSLEGMLKSVNSSSCDYCTACWTGNYPLKWKGKIGKSSLEKKCCGV